MKFFHLIVYLSWWNVLIEMKFWFIAVYTSELEGNIEAVYLRIWMYLPFMTLKLLFYLCQ